MQEYSPLQPGDVKTYSTWTGFALCINIIIGTGVFNIPYAFYSSGILLSILLLVICSIFAWFCLVWFLEVSARTEGITSCKEQGTDYPHHQITFRKFELTQLCELFYGYKGKIAAQLVLCLYCYGLLWAYAAVFASSVDSLFWQFIYGKTCDIYDTHTWTGGCQMGYFLCLSLYACFVVPFSCMNIVEQAVVQVLLTVYRLLAFTVMFITVIIGLSYPENPNIPENQFFPGDPIFPGNSELFAGNSENHIAFSTLVKWSGFASIFTTAAVALNFHFTLPDLVRPVKTKKYLRRMTTAALIVATLIYLLLGIICSLYFGPRMISLATLNWQNYTGLDGGWGGSMSDRPWWAIIVQLVVMLFPVFDMLSVFPMIGVTLGDNLLQFIPNRSIMHVCSHNAICLGSQKNDKKFSMTICRLLATVPPIVMAAALGHLDQIFKFTGLFAFFLQLLFPCLLQLKSRAKCEETWGVDSWLTMYSMHISRRGYVWATLVFGIGAFLFAMFDFVVDVVNPNFWGKG